MITAIILCKLGINVIPQVIKNLEQINEIKTIMSVTGIYDLIIEIEVDTTEKLYEVFANKIDQIEGIVESNTHVVMKSWEK
ncbi:MAG: Lrp/AsnC ligand binding domain-containing protein [Candidatus Lokiarchaeota archaeon]